MASFALYEDTTDNINLLMTSLYGEGGPDKAWEIYEHKGVQTIAIGNSVLHIYPGDRVWIKNTSVLVECAAPRSEKAKP